MTVEYLDLADYIGIASEVTGLDEAVIVRIADLGLADSALLAAVAVAFGDADGGVVEEPQRRVSVPGRGGVSGLIGHTGASTNPGALHSNPPSDSMQTR